MKTNNAFTFKINWFLLLGIFFGILIIGLLLLYAFSYEARGIYTAKRLLKEHRHSQAVTLLENIKLQSKAENPELDFLLFYGYLLQHKFLKAQHILHHLPEIDCNNKLLLQEAFFKLSSTEEDKTLTLAFKKAKNLKLDETFFINLSKQRINFQGESFILEYGIRHLKQCPESQKRLKEYLMRRILETVKTLENEKDFEKELKYLERARKLGIEIKDENFASEIHQRLGKVFQNLNEPLKAKEHLDLYEKLNHREEK